MTHAPVSPERRAAQTACAAFDNALSRLAADLGAVPAVRALLFDETPFWRRVLAHKLAAPPADCLVCAVAGGTNTGKSTLFNALSGADISPVRGTAAATRHPVFAGGAALRAACLEGRLLPGFDATPLEDPEDAIRAEAPESALYLAEVGGERAWALIDTPDVDSIDQANWDIATRVGAAADVLIAVLTPEKYQDERVVAFFRQAHAAGRIVLPVMNKARPDNNYEEARGQLPAFVDAAGLTAPPVFAMPYTADAAALPAADRLDAPGSLGSYLDALDPHAVEAETRAQSRAYVARGVAAFLDRVEGIIADLRETRAALHEEAARCAPEYAPVPDEAVRALVHEFLQRKRGGFDRAVGDMSRTVFNHVANAQGRLRRMVLRRATLEDQPTPCARANAEAIHAIVNGLTARVLERVNESEPWMRALLAEALDEIDADALGERVSADVFASESLSDEYRDHAMRALEAWWEAHPNRRRAIKLLVQSVNYGAAALALPVALYTGGFGVPELAMLSMPLGHHLVQYGLGDWYFDLRKAWRREQQAALAGAIEKHFGARVARPIDAALDALETGAETLRKDRECLEI